jgi:hypothetical protein
MRLVDVRVEAVKERIARLNDVSFNKPDDQISVGMRRRYVNRGPDRGPLRVFCSSPGAPFSPVAGHGPPGTRRNRVPESNGATPCSVPYGLTQPMTGTVLMEFFGLPSIRRSL